MRTLTNLLCFSLLLALNSPLFAAEKLSADHVKVSWLAPEKFVSGELNPLAIYFELDPEWHVYWVNPGDSGAAPKFDFKADGAKRINPIRWPAPHRLPVAHLTNLGYEKAVAFPFTLEPSNDGKTLKLTAKLEWLVCKEDCIPGFGTLTLERPIVTADLDESERWQEDKLKTLLPFLKSVPQNAESSPVQIKKINRTQDTLVVSYVTSSEVEFDIFPLDGNLASAKAPVRTEETITFDLIPGANETPTTGFVITANDESWELLDLPVQMGGALVPATESVWLLIFFAFIGGIILNLMPCVFPVISLKFFSLIKTDQGASERLREALLYTAGVVVTFLILGGALFVLRASGSAIGWGFHLQNPVMVLGLIFIFWLMALNFWGLFEIGTSTMNHAGRFSWNSSFGVGILSVFVAAPCTGPFMGAALGATATLPALLGLIIFASLGLGLASPFLIFAMSPRLISLLPRPGAWMDSFKQFMGFLMAATVIWLAWVLGSQIGDLGWLVANSLILLWGFLFWIRPRLKRVIYTAVMISTMFVTLQCFRLVHKSEPTKSSPVATSAWAPYSKETIAQVRSEGRAVFVDFTAAWCITCQVNKKTVLDTEAGQKIFSDKNIYLIRADWTNYDPAITAALAEFGRNSVPTYIYYPSDGSAAKVLPQILTLSIIEDL